jgi:hypothetical protein
MEERLKFGRTAMTLCLKESHSRATRCSPGKHCKLGNSVVSNRCKLAERESFQEEGCYARRFVQHFLHFSPRKVSSNFGWRFLVRTDLMLVPLRSQEFLAPSLRVNYPGSLPFLLWLVRSRWLESGPFDTEICNPYIANTDKMARKASAGEVVPLEVCSVRLKSQLSAESFPLRRLSTTAKSLEWPASWSASTCRAPQ